MARYLLTRLASSLLVLFGLSLLAFFLVRLVPGDTVTAMLGMNYSDEAAEALRQKLRLDEPLPVQYGVWLWYFVQGDWGTTVGGQPVIEVLLDSMAVTLQLAGFALLFAAVTGIPLGLAAAARQGKPIDALASFIGMAGLSVPAFWLGTMLILIFALYLEWLPSIYMAGPSTRGVVGHLRHMVLPSIALGMAVAAVLTRTTRSSMLEVIQQDYVRTAQAKGLGRQKVLWKHVARNGLIPVLTIGGLQVGYLLGGSIVIEEVFSLPGMGKLMLVSLNSRDYPTLQAGIMVIGFIFLLVNFIVDMLYAWTDPRVSVGKK